jgi:hypothetical protein
MEGNMKTEKDEIVGRADGSAISRKAKRVRTDEQVTITTAQQMAKIIDLSEVGMFIATPLILEKNSDLVIYIKNLMFCATVVRCGTKKIKNENGEKNNVSGIAVKFSSLTPKHRILIQNILGNQPESKKLIKGYDPRSVVLVDPDMTSRFIYQNILLINQPTIPVFAIDKFSRDLIDSLKQIGASVLVCEYTEEAISAISEIRRSNKGKNMRIVVLSGKHNIDKRWLESLRVEYLSKASCTPLKFREKIVELRRGYRI